MLPCTDLISRGNGISKHAKRVSPSHVLDVHPVTPSQSPVTFHCHDHLAACGLPLTSNCIFHSPSDYGDYTQTSCLTRRSRCFPRRERRSSNLLPQVCFIYFLNSNNQYKYNIINYNYNYIFLYNYNYNYN